MNKNEIERFENTPAAKKILLKNIAERAKKIKANAERIASRCASIDDKINLALFESEVDFSQNEDKKPDLDAEILAVQNSILDIKLETFFMYYCLGEPETYDGCLPYYSSTNAQAYEKIFKTFDVDVAIGDEFVAIKLPLLWSRNRYYTRKKRDVHLGDGLAWFKRELDIKLWEKSLELPAYDQCNIAYLHVTDGKGLRACDVDNYDTKAVTDVVSDYICLTDSPSVCSFSAAYSDTPELDEGTYVIVTPTYGNPPTLDTLIDLAKRIKTL